MDVYKEDSLEDRFVIQALKAGVPAAQLELIMVLAELHNKAPLDIQEKWLNHKIGIQQVFRKIQ